MIHFQIEADWIYGVKTQVLCIVKCCTSQAVAN